MAGELYHFPPLTVTDNGFVQTPWATLFPPNSRIAAFVRSSGVGDGDPEFLRTRPLLTTLNAALAYCRSGRGDIVGILPDHAENISSADQMSNLVAGTRIIGMGTGRLRPTFTWTTALSTFLFDVDNVWLHNCILNLEPGTGTIAVAAPITVSGAGCAITNCQMRTSTDVDNKTTIGITTTATADHFTFSGNDVYGATAGECTTFLQLVGADYLRMYNNKIVVATSAVAVGPIRFLTTASTFVDINGLKVRNNKAASEQAVTGMAGVTGEVNNLHMAVLSNAAGALTGAWSTPASIVFGRQCYVSNELAERAALFGTESA